jgi:hypothetical protein
MIAIRSTSLRHQPEEVLSMWMRNLIVLSAVLSFAGPVLADSSAKPRAARRAEKLDQERTLAVKAKRKVHQIDTVYVFARPQRPLASVETSTQRFQFPVGTARYSERDRRFLRSARGERW